MGMTDYIVMFSGGLTSYEAARRAIEVHGHDNVRIWFSDTNTEDEDLYRFNRDVERILEHPIEVLHNDGETVWDIFEWRKIMGNSRLDPCSHHLKRQPLARKLKAEYPNPEDAVVVLGMDGIEDCKRTERAAKNQLPYKTWFPLLEEPIVMKSHISKSLKEIGVERPRLYDLGFSHNNCGGFCVKAGLGQFAHLLKQLPERYAYHEKKEQEFREFIGKDVSIMRDRRNNETKPMTMRAFRERIEGGETFAYDTGWECLCFVESQEPEWL
jgi:hypothetical protein